MPVEAVLLDQGGDTERMFKLGEGYGTCPEKIGGTGMGKGFSNGGISRYQVESKRLFLAGERAPIMRMRSLVTYWVSFGTGANILILPHRWRIAK